ncbi:MAG: hypothetical protein DI549_10850 [Ancylobacter novellus]|uniref:Uncharacterized protein n=1 Tax=Ancylobacter novellus TaxID=921 RepID=A0A2W5QVA3_ANCNO|nr:MAG: hypothetical protein DI549_10850 [Ancylobacter novellus]
MGEAMVKVSIDIEDLLVWAYRVELPKVPAAPVAPARFSRGWAPMSAFGDLLAVIDEGDVRNDYGVTPDRTALSGPHPDALAVHRTVIELSSLHLGVPDGWWPFDDMASPDGWGKLGPAVVADVLGRLAVRGDDGAMRFKTAPGWLVQKHAIMGTAPDWLAEPIEYRTVRAANGKARWFMKRLVAQFVNDEIIGYTEHEVDGWCGSRRRPFPDAYHKMELVPSPFHVGCDRAEYEVWYVALVALAEMLAESLTAHRVTGPRRASRPWAPDAPQTRILPSLLGTAQTGA